ncbi:MAG: proteasome assembly chaperone family protein [Thermoplasmata archaeon]|nr:proteasome assembly chaperone family protein [Thermoplasmata archaeon]
MKSMDVEIIFEEHPELRDPIFVEGLPGVGNVGKLAAEHLLEEIGAKRFAVVYSKYFPPQVLVEDDGTIKLVRNELYFYKREGDAGPDLILLVGDYQGLTPEGQYELSSAIIDLCTDMGVKRIYTLGGFGVGKMVEEPRVLGATTTLELVEEMKENGVIFSRGEPGSGIVGASGLLLGLGHNKGIEAVCLMGETSGYFIDPNAARKLLLILSKLLDLEMDLAKLEEKADQIERITAKLKDIEKMEKEGSFEDLNYIG